MCPERAGSTIWEGNWVGRTQEILQLCKAATGLPAVARAAHTFEAKCALCRGCSSAEQEPRIACRHPASVLMPSMHACDAERLCLCKRRAQFPADSCLETEIADSESHGHEMLKREISARAAPPSNKTNEAKFVTSHAVLCWRNASSSTACLLVVGEAPDLGHPACTAPLPSVLAPRPEIDHGKRDARVTLIWWDYIGTEMPCKDSRRQARTCGAQVPAATMGSLKGHAPRCAGGCAAGARACPGSERRPRGG